MRDEGGQVCNRSSLPLAVPAEKSSAENIEKPLIFQPNPLQYLGFAQKTQNPRYLSYYLACGTEMMNSKLILESGESFAGVTPQTQTDRYFGEIVFNTGMVGYVESLTDPSYAGQILCFTYPLVGNYGVPDKAAWESNRIQVSGAIFSELAEHPSHYDMQQSLRDWLTQENIPFITHVDTRALTKVLRSQGVVNGVIQPDTQTPPTTFTDFEHADWVKTVSIPKPIEFGSGSKRIIVVDCGIKQNILRQLSAFPITIKQVPYDYDYTNESFDGLFISNGPGNPAVCTKTIEILRKALQLGKPTFGICLGAQLMGLAVGASTYKLPFGHRAQNQPCIDTKTQRCYLTSQNHGYAIDDQTLPHDWTVTFRSLNDQTVQGIAHQTKPFFAVQFHPEANPGPVDTHWLFKTFYELL